MKKLTAVILFFKFCWLSGSSLDLNYGSSGILYVPTVMAVARARFFVKFSLKFSVHSFASRFSGLARLGVAWGLGLDGSSLV